jgi:hypothetical protein
VHFINTMFLCLDRPIFTNLITSVSRNPSLKGSLLTFSSGYNPYSITLVTLISLLGENDFTLTQTYLSPEGGSPRESGGTEATIGVSL